MLDRADLTKKFKELLGNDNVYFQPPTNTKMHYPAIRYSLDGVDVKHYDNKRELNKKQYSVTHIYSDLSKELTDKFLGGFEYISFDNRSIIDGLYNDHYTIYW